jgi:hypothetical protein
VGRHHLLVDIVLDVVVVVFAVVVDDVDAYVAVVIVIN